MSLLDDLADHLVVDAVGTIGTDIWKGQLPDGSDITADPLLALIEMPGEPPLAVMGTAADPLRRPRVQLVGRGTRYDTVRALVQSALDSLEMTDTSINGNRHLIVEALQEPHSMGTDGEGRFRVVCNVAVVRER